MKPRTVLIAACMGLVVALSACTSSTGRVSPAPGQLAGRHGAVITVGSFDFPESVLLAEIYGQALAAASLRRVAQIPGKMIMLFGGSALITLAYIGALAASVQAFGGGPGIVLIGAVYLGAAALAAAAPSPGGLGAIEAALIAGLTGVGMQSGPAVSAVLLYRLATYWLPVAPGWLSWRVLQRRGYV